MATVNINDYAKSNKSKKRNTTLKSTNPKKNKGLKIFFQIVGTIFFSLCKVIFKFTFVFYSIDLRKLYYL